MIDKIRKKDLPREKLVRDGLRRTEAQGLPLPGISAKESRTALTMQLIESLRRVDYIESVASRSIDSRRADPSSELFDPVRAALYLRGSNVEEAFWLLFLFVHFGKHRNTGWRLVRDVYGRLGDGQAWTWTNVSRDPADFRHWLAENEARLRGADGIKRAFGNHRKYETLKISSARGTATVVESYVSWIGHFGSHQALVQDAMTTADGDGREAFAHLYKSMGEVISFGRTARFDLLTMVGKVGLAPIAPNSPYFSGATGPLTGARLLFYGDKNSPASWREVEGLATMLDAHIPLGPFAMQVIEDALCNWQKSPDKFVAFRG